jgi:hypothetical protein
MIGSTMSEPYRANPQTQELCASGGSCRSRLEGRVSDLGSEPLGSVALRERRLRRERAVAGVSDLGSEPLGSVALRERRLRPERAEAA